VTSSLLWAMRICSHGPGLTTDVSPTSSGVMIRSNGNILRLMFMPRNEMTSSHRC
jgi:hypothetical protein